MQYIYNSEDYLTARGKADQELTDFVKQKCFFAFDDKQLDEGKKKIHATEKELYKASNLGMFYKKTDSKKLHELLDAATATKEDYLLSSPEHFFNAFVYELFNHEYCITMDTAPAIEALGLEDFVKTERFTEYFLDAYKQAKKFVLDHSEC